MDDIIGLPDRRESRLPTTFDGWVSTTDHKAIGVAYALTALGSLAVGGVLALGCHRTSARISGSWRSS